MKLSTKIKCFIVGVEMDIKECRKRKLARKLGLVPCPVYVEDDDEDDKN